MKTCLDCNARYSLPGVQNARKRCPVCAKERRRNYKREYNRESAEPGEIATIAFSLGCHWRGSQLGEQSSRRENVKYSMTEPCNACPFLIGSGFTYESLEAHASGEFACHKACKIVDDDDGASVFVERNKNTPHCAGALIFLEKQNRPHQMMRICERLGFYDRRKLNMNAKVGSKPADYRKRRPIP